MLVLNTKTMRLLVNNKICGIITKMDSIYQYHLKMACLAKCKDKKEVVTAPSFYFFEKESQNQKKEFTMCSLLCSQFTKDVLPS